MNEVKILNASLEVLNEKGYSHTSIDDVLERNDISKEEFDAHFKSLDEVVEKLFYQLCLESDEASDALDKSGPLISLLYRSTLESYRIQVSYKFIFYEFYEITKSIDSIRDRYFELISLRKTQLIHFFNLLKGAGTFRPEIVPGHFDNLAYQMTMLSDYWLTHNYLLFGEENNYRFYAKMIYAMLLPYLTEKGLKEYQDSVSN